MLWWRRLWDASFSLGSILAAILLGVALGNIARGVPLGADREFTGGLIDLLNPYALLTGAATLSLFVMHGAVYLLMKTEGSLHDLVRGWINRTVAVFAAFYLLLTAATFLTLPHMTVNILRMPLLFVLPALNVLAVANIPREVRRGRDFRAFLSSCASMAALLLLFGIGMYPNLVRSVPDAAHSLTIYNAASSDKTLGIMTVIAAIGMPLVLTYTAGIYWIFRGKVKLDHHSY
jgi:cytochrome d ubiquinol oxidase subunit II